ncbi:unnamed protein product [Owenia fusiformis]|uniref:E2F/DP family winged-helix DNA-binding domain-containing protein n=1 Tax=Owenia fusiformis TaxID=6347 RepID=A0A8S4PYG2_OWEFU|nr:unnamed protein product [Owenia fusiformis]
MDAENIAPSFIPGDFNINNYEENTDDAGIETAALPMFESSQNAPLSQDLQCSQESLPGSQESAEVQLQFLNELNSQEKQNMMDDLDTLQESTKENTMVTAQTFSPEFRHPTSPRPVMGGFKNFNISTGGNTIDHSNVTPTKPVNSTDPWTPTANLKVLMSAASPEIRNREKQKELFQDEAKDLTCQEDINIDVMEEEPTNEFGGGKIKVEGSRKDKSLGLLCQKFLNLYPEYPIGHPTEICLDNLALSLGVERRRIYDIINVLESVEIVSRIAKNRYAWHGKTTLTRTLARLKQLGEAEQMKEQLDNMGLFMPSDSMARLKQLGEDEQMKEQLDNMGLFMPSESGTKLETMKELLHVTDHTKVPLKNNNENNTRDSIRDPMFKAAYQRKEKSLGIMSQKFLMLFLVADYKPISLELAAKILIGDPNVDKTENSKFKTKIRRLYDIANILSSLNLIEKVHINVVRGRKPAFKYIGPNVDDPTLVDTDASDGSASTADHRQLSCHSVLENNSGRAQPQATITQNPQPTSKVTNNKPKSSSLNRLKFDGREPKSKRSLSRHASFEMICAAAEKERSKLYAHLPGGTPSKLTEKPAAPTLSKTQTMKVLQSIPQATTNQTDNSEVQSVNPKDVNPKAKNRIIFKTKQTKVPAPAATIVHLTKEQIDAVLRSLNTTNVADAQTQSSPSLANSVLLHLKKASAQNQKEAQSKTAQKTVIATTLGDIKSEPNDFESESNKGTELTRDIYESPTNVELRKVGKKITPTHDSLTPEQLYKETPLGNMSQAEDANIRRSKRSIQQRHLGADYEYTQVTKKSRNNSSAELDSDESSQMSTSSQDAEVERITHHSLQRRRLTVKPRPSPLRALHLEPEFRESPSTSNLNTPSPSFENKFGEYDNHLASPLPEADDNLNNNKFLAGIDPSVPMLIGEGLRPASADELEQKNAVAATSYQPIISANIMRHTAPITVVRISPTEITQRGSDAAFPASMLSPNTITPVSFQQVNTITPGRNINVSFKNTQSGHFQGGSGTTQMTYATQLAKQPWFVNNPQSLLTTGANQVSAPSGFYQNTPGGFIPLATAISSTGSAGHQQNIPPMQAVRNLTMDMIEQISHQ